MAVKVTKPRNRMAQDATFINIRQLNRRLAVVEKQVKFLLAWRRGLK